MPSPDDDNNYTSYKSMSSAILIPFSVAVRAAGNRMRKTEKSNPHTHKHAFANVSNFLGHLQKVSKSINLVTFFFLKLHLSFAIYLDIAAK